MDFEEFARKIVVIGGTATEEDAEAVRAAAMLLPIQVLAFFADHGVTIVACRHSVTEVERTLIGVVPRGWDDTGKTWDDVPGTFLQKTKQVVVATIELGGKRVVPPRGYNHGSANLTVHESLHGHDYLKSHRPLRDPSFLNARTADIAKLGVYEIQTGQAGLEETYAESGARYFANDTQMPGEWPNLYQYWQAGLALATETALDERVNLEVAPLNPEAPIGTVDVAENGDIVLDLRAESEGGAIGHALIRVTPAQLDYDRLYNRLVQAATETGGAGPRLLRPAK